MQVELEQYPTGPHIASRMLYTVLALLPTFICLGYWVSSFMIMTIFHGVYLLGRELVWRCERQGGGWLWLWLWYVRCCRCTFGCRVSDQSFKLLFLNFLTFYLGNAKFLEFLFFIIYILWRSWWDFCWMVQERKKILYGTMWKQSPLFHLLSVGLYFCFALNRRVIGIDVDSESLEIASQNAEDLEVQS